MKKDEPILTHTFVFNRQDNSGEHVSITTKFIPNGDPGGVCFTNQEIELQSYCNCASINLFGANLSSQDLRQLANELDEAHIMAKAQAAKLEKK